MGMYFLVVIPAKAGAAEPEYDFPNLLGPGDVENHPGPIDRARRFKRWYHRLRWVFGADNRPVGPCQ